MPKQNNNVAQRAWNILRLALLWARKGGIFKRWKLVIELRLVSKYLKRLGHTTPPSQIHYLERELSFDETPIFNVNMNRPGSMRFHMPRIPCINPHVVDFDYDFDDEEDDVGYHSGRKAGDDYDGESSCEGCKEKVSNGEEGIDIRAEEFIAKFYEQMKLQRQLSYLQYTETPKRD